MCVCVCIYTYTHADSSGQDRTENDDDDDDDDDENLAFDMAACGFAHTMMVTDNGYICVYVHVCMYVRVFDFRYGCLWVRAYNDGH